MRFGGERIDLENTARRQSLRLANIYIELFATSVAINIRPGHCEAAYMRARYHIIIGASLDVGAPRRIIGPSIYGLPWREMVRAYLSGTPLAAFIEPYSTASSMSHSCERIVCTAAVISYPSFSFARQLTKLGAPR